MEAEKHDGTKPDSEKQTEALVIRLTPSERERLKKQAAIEARPESNLARFAVMLYLDDNDEDEQG